MGLRGDGFEVVGVSLFDHGPVDGVHLHLNRGLTALYGLNGSGKTTILNSVADVLSGVSQHASKERSCVHITLDEGVENTTRPGGSFLVALRKSLEAPLGVNGSDGDDNFLDLVSRLLQRIDSADQFVGTGSSDESHVPPPKGSWFYSDPFDEYDPICFSLIPSGTLQAPEWEVYLSAPFSDSMLEGAREIEEWWTSVSEAASAGRDLNGLLMNRPAAAGWLDGDRHWQAKVLYDGIRSAPSLDWPIGFPIPMRHLTGISIPPMLASVPRGIDSLNEETRQSILAERTRVAQDQSLVGMADESAVVLADWLTTHRDRLERRVNALYKRTFRDPPQLELDLKHPDRWFVGEAPEWRARSGGVDFSFSKLSNSQQRWASLAISAVLAERDASRPSLIIIDEPESGLHRSAETILPEAMRALVENGTSVLTATHSPALLSPTSTTANRLLHVVMAGGFTMQPRLVELDVAGNLREVALTSGLGLTAADMLTRVRVAVWVEGQHDVTVLRHFLGRELAEAGAHLFPLHGAVKAPALADAGVLLDVTDATLVVIVDNVDGIRARELWDRAQTQAQTGQASRAKRTLGQLKELRTAEGHWLADLGMRALELRRLHRIVALPLARFDIACYLPIELLVPGAPSWGQLHNEYEKVHPKSPNRVTFKHYLATKWNSPITTETITHALSQMDGTPEEIQELGEDIRRLGLLPPSDTLEAAMT